MDGPNRLPAIYKAWFGVGDGNGTDTQVSLIRDRQCGKTEVKVFFQVFCTKAGKISVGFSVQLT